jgi:hypothetical protein
MTDQSIRQWTRPTRTLERAGPDRPEPETSTQDGPAPDVAAAERSAEDGAVYGSAARNDDAEQTSADPGAPSELDHAEPEHAVGVASIPDAEPGPDPQAADEHDAGELLPGSVPTGPVALFDGATTERFRDRWQQLQLRFIDDPHTVATQAGTLADEMVTVLRDAVDQQRTALEDWQSDNGADAHFGDTERLRVAVRRYRDFVDRLLAM